MVTWWIVAFLPIVIFQGHYIIRRGRSTGGYTCNDPFFLSSIFFSTMKHQNSTKLTLEIKIHPQTSPPVRKRSWISLWHTHIYNYSPFRHLHNFINRWHDCQAWFDYFLLKPVIQIWVCSTHARIWIPQTYFDPKQIKFVFLSNTLSQQGH